MGEKKRMGENKTARYGVLLAGLLLSGCAHQQESLVIPAPSSLPGVERTMKTAGFWVSRHSSPDSIVLSEQEVVQLNTTIQDKLRLTEDVAAQPEKVYGKNLKAEFEKQLKAYSGKTYYLVDGTVAGGQFFEKIRTNMALTDIPEADVIRFGFVVHYADQRILPTDHALLVEKGDVDFDELQNDALDIGTPVAILHETRDGEWCYAQAGASIGWIKKELLAFASREQVSGWQAMNQFIVTLSAKTDIYLDEEVREHYDYVQMGARFPTDGRVRPGVYKISFPKRQEDGEVIFAEGYVKKDDVREGYLPYTPRSIIDQAFKLLNAPYGWGGMYGEQDCSRFVQEVFATVGIRMPRNSGEQIKVGKMVASFPAAVSDEEKLKSFHDGVLPGATLLGMKGHIMLYLGEENNRPYAIHATWAFRENRNGAQVKNVINKVVVSDLSLGEGGSRGSLLKRLNKITKVGQ